ncbi:MAG TPA: hypothetical protein VIJ92_07115 [Ginsengibacter sp.]
MKEEYHCEIYYVLRTFFFVLSIILILGIITFLAIWLLNAPLESGLFLIIFAIISPFVFKKRIRSFFTKDCLLEFDDNGFSLAIGNSNDHKYISTAKYKWKDIKAYKTNFTASGWTILDFYLQNRIHKEFIFIDNKDEEKSINEKSVFSVFHLYIKEFNAPREKNEQIVLVPGFFATYQGLVALWVVGCLMTTTLILHIIKHNNHAIFLVIGALFLIPIIGVRKQQESVYNRIKNLD